MISEWFNIFFRGALFIEMIQGQSANKKFVCIALYVILPNIYLQWQK